MRFEFGAIPDGKETAPQGWQAMGELNPFWMQAVALPLGGLAAAAMGAAWLGIQPLQQMAMVHPAWLCLALVLLIPAHELLHAAAFPRFGLTGACVIGFWPSRMLAYARYTDTLSRERFMAVLAMPLAVLSLAPLALAALTGRAAALGFFVSVLNTLASGGDMLALGLLFWRVPRGAALQSHGWRTFWKPRA